MPRVTGIGEILIDLIAAEPGPLEEATGFLKAPGGAPANAGVAVAHIGGEVGFVSKVGDDAFGRYLRRYLADQGVDVAGVQVASGYTTALAFSSPQTAGTVDFLFYRTGCAHEQLAPADLHPDTMQGVKYLLTGSNVMITNPVMEAVNRAIEMVRTRGGRIVFDVNSDLHQEGELEWSIEGKRM